MTQSKPLTFRELAVGDHFIHFPTDGDDSGHGGFRNGKNLFKKTEDKASDIPGLVYRAETTRDGALVTMHPDTKVLKINT